MLYILPLQTFCGTQETQDKIIVTYKQFVRGGYSSGCNESTKKHSPVEKSSGRTLHYVMTLLPHSSV